MGRHNILKTVSLVVLGVLFAGQSLLAQTFPGIVRAIDRQEYSKAQNIIAAKLGEDPKNERLYYYRGVCYFETEAFSQAKSSFQKGINYGARYPMNYIGLGGVYAKENNFSEAKAKFDKAKELNKDRAAEIMLGIANGYLKSDERKFLDEAEKILLNVASLEKENPEAYISLGDLYMKQGIEELALDKYQEAIQRDPTYLKGYLRIGQIKVKNKEFNEGADAFRKALEVDPNFAPAYKELGELWYKAKKFEKAKENYEKYVGMMKDDLNAQVRYASFLFLTKDYQLAIDKMEPLLVDTTTVVMLRLLGYCYVEVKQPEKAKGYMDKYFAKIEMKYILPSDYEYSGDIKRLMKQDSLGEIEYLKVLEADTERVEVYAKIADMYFKSKRYEKAGEYFGKLIGAGKGKFKEYFYWGNSYYMVKDYPNADTAFSRMITKYPKVHIGYLFSGRIKQMSDPDSEEGLALPMYQKVYELLNVKESLKKKEIKDFKESLNYLGYYYWSHGEDCQNAIPYWHRILDFEPEHEGALQIIDYCKNKGIIYTPEPEQE